MMLFRVVLLAVCAASCLAENLPGFPADFNGDPELLSAISDEVAKKFADSYLNYMQTGVESAALRQLSAQLADSHSKKDIFNKDYPDLDAPDGFFLCTTCRAVVNVGIRTFRDEDGEMNGPHNRRIAEMIALDICRRLEMQTEEVCSGLFDSHWDLVEYIIYNSEIDSNTFCGLFMDYGFCKVKNPAYNFTLTIDKAQLPVTASKAGLPAKGENDLKILHLTDIHFDPLYEVGALAECDEPMCCQRHKDIAEGTSKAAGYWGDYRDCDSPWQLVEASLKFMSQTHQDIDYIYQTGDVVDHMVWATSEGKNTEVLTRVHNKIYELFPNVPVYPCIGNHEPHPLNVFSPENVPTEINTRWLYETLYQDWSKWLPPSTKETILKGGYYTVSPKKGFRIISLNNNDCYTKNWWLMHSGLDKMEQLQWLHDTLLAAEAAGESVHILAHIPTGGNGCWTVWSREFVRIVARFRNTIGGIFNGHSHKDELNVFFTKQGYAVNVAWNGGCLTPFSDNNPNYVVYEVEPEHMQVLDYQTWVLNLTEANLMGASQPLKWEHEYTFSEEFTADLSPAGLDALLERLAREPNLLRKYWRFLVTSADPRLKRGCSRGCLMNTICNLATTVSDQKQRCKELQKTLATALDNETTTPSGTSSTSTSTTTPGSSPTTTQTTTTTKNPNDGAAVGTLSMTVLSLCFVIKKLLS